MKNLPTYDSFLNEAKLPFSIEKTLKSSHLAWSKDEEIADELYDQHKGDTSEAYAYVARNKQTGVEYVFKTWFNDRQYWIQLEEDEEVIFIQEYPQNEKRYYDQDCENIVGFSF